jgi:hypothetical protein
MIRLREAGAPFTEADQRTSLEDWSGTRVTKRMFRAHVNDILCDRSVTGKPPAELTLSAAIRYFISEVGGPTTITEFKRKYPWAGAVLRQGQKEATEDQKRQSELKPNWRRDKPTQI